MGKRKEIKTSRQRSEEALRRARVEPPRSVENVVEAKEVILEDGVVDEVKLLEHYTFISEFPEVIPLSSNVNFQIFEQSIAIGEDPPMSKELDQLFRTDLEGVSLAMVRGFRRWKDYLHL